MKSALFLFLTLISSQILIGQNVDSERSEVGFKISNMYVNTVEGVFKDVSGTVNLSPTDGEKFIDVCLEVSTIDTENDERDEHLKDEDFFHVSKFPRICFKAHSLKEQKDGSYKATGILSMHGVDKEITVPLTIESGVLASTFEVDRTDFQLGSEYGGFTVGKTVTLDVKLILYNR